MLHVLLGPSWSEKGFTETVSCHCQYHCQYFPCYCHCHSQSYFKCHWQGLCHSHSHCPSFLPHAAQSPRRVLQAQKKGQNGAAESLRELFRAQLDRHQHLAAVLLEFVPKSHPDQQRRRRMAQRAQPTGAGRLIICLSLRYGSSVLSHISSFRIRVLFPYLYVFSSFVSQGKSQLPLYMLIQLLHGESRLTTLQIRMVSEHRLCRLQRRTYGQLQAKVFSLWDQYENSDRTGNQLLRACSELYGPRDC